MTVGTSIGGLGVIERQDHRRPNVGGLTGFALFTGNRVRGGFVSSCTDTVVTTGTVTRLTRYGAMIKEYLQPAGSIVADLARLCRRDVCRTFAAGNGAVVTVFA